MATTPMIRRRRYVVGLLLVAGVVMGACGSGGGGGSGAAPGAQPTPNGSQFTDGTFARLPSYPGATPTGPASSTQGITTRSFAVNEASPRVVMRRLTRDLRTDGWDAVQPMHAVDQTWRSVWKQSGRELLVTTVRAPALDPASQHQDVQYTYQLGDRGVSVPTV